LFPVVKLNLGSTHAELILNISMFEINMPNSVLSYQQKYLRISKRVNCVADINLDILLVHNKRGIILDLDNTLVSEDDRYFSPDIQLWIEQAKQKDFKLFILSNGKRQQRLTHWSSFFDIPAIGAARKPLRKSFNRAIHALKIPKHQIVVIGDSLHTDGLGAWFIQCDWIQVASLPHPLHWWERLLTVWSHIPFPKSRLTELKLANPHFLDH
jgi:uncharacterized protein